MNPYEDYQKRRLEHVGVEPYEVDAPHRFLTKHGPGLIGAGTALATWGKQGFNPAAIPDALMSGAFANFASRGPLKDIGEDLTEGDDHHHPITRHVYNHMPGANDPSHPVAHAAGNLAAGALAFGVPAIALGAGGHYAMRYLAPRYLPRLGEMVLKGYESAAPSIAEMIRPTVEKTIDGVITESAKPLLESESFRRNVGRALTLGALSGGARAWGQHHRHHDPRLAYREAHEKEMSDMLQELYALEAEHDGTIHPDYVPKAASIFANPHASLIEKIARNLYDEVDLEGDSDVTRNEDGSWTFTHSHEGTPMSHYSKRRLYQKYGPDWQHMAPLHELTQHALIGLGAHAAHGHPSLEHEPIEGARYDVEVEGPYGDRASYKKNPHMAAQIVDEVMEGDYGEGLYTHHKLTFPSDHPVSRRANELMKEVGGKTHSQEHVIPARGADRSSEGTLLGALGGAIGGAVLTVKSPALLPIGFYGGGVAGGVLGNRIGSAMKYTIPEKRYVNTDVFDDERAFHHATGHYGEEDLARFKAAAEVFGDPFASLMARLEKKARAGRGANVGNTAPAANPTASMVEDLGNAHAEIEGLKGKLGEANHALGDATKSLGRMKNVAKFGLPAVGVAALAGGAYLGHRMLGGQQKEAGFDGTRLREGIEKGLGEAQAIAQRFGTEVKNEFTPENAARAAIGAGVAGTVSAFHQKGGEDGHVNPWRVAEHAAIGGAAGAFSNKIESGAKRLGRFFDNTEKAYESVQRISQKLDEDPKGAIGRLIVGTKRAPATNEQAVTEAAVRQSMMGKLLGKFKHEDGHA